MLGSELDCVRCDRMEWPDGLTTYRRTPEFDAVSLPDGLRSEHATKRGVWGRLHVVEGELTYHVDAPIHRSLRVEPASTAVIVPEVRHRVEPGRTVRFFVEFARVPQVGGGSRSRGTCRRTRARRLRRRAGRPPPRC